MIPTTLIKPLLIGLFLIGVFGAGYWEGYSGQHEKLITFTAQVEALGKAQADQVKIADQKNKEQANEADKNIQIATDGIAAYYRDHPVVRVRNTCDSSVAMPSPASDTSKPDDTATSPDAPSYVSEYNPEQVEQVAARLDGLQKLLIKDGATVK